MYFERGYRPLTATPFRCNSAYREIEPCLLLQPYVRCFWGEDECSDEIEINKSYEIVIPDTCVDIIYRIDDAGNILTSDFVGINDRSFCAPRIHKTGRKISVFAIRFYAWSAYVFCEDSFAGTVNVRCDAGERFHWLDSALRSRLSEPGELLNRTRLTEELLLKKLAAGRENALVDGIMYDILRHQGRLEISRLSKDNFISSRQMERQFQEYIGMAPKKLSNLVRYQCVWRDIVSQSDFDIANAVFQYGYTDAPHLLREFKRYHSMNIREAKKMAFQIEK